jgi:GNAT superfamily N-acetyltransferase
MSSILYRDAGPADAALVADLCRRSFVETFGHLYRPEDLAAFLARMSEEAWRGELSDPAFDVRLAEAAGEAVAYAKLGPLALPVEPAGPALELRQLYVLAPWQGAGIAPSLMDWLIRRARARGAGELFLSVWTENHRARLFYARYGFAYVGPYSFMVGDQADEDEIMRLTLEDGK